MYMSFSMIDVFFFGEWLLALFWANLHKIKKEEKMTMMLDLP